MSTALNTEYAARHRPVPRYMQAPQVRAFWQHVSSIMPDTGIVLAHEFDLMEIHRLAPDLIVCDVDIESCRNRLRFVGTRVVEVFGEETTGRYLDEVNIGPYRSQQLAAFNMAVASRWPQWTKVSVSRSKDEGVIPVLQTAGIVYERLVVPLAEKDGVTVKQLAAIVAFSEGPCDHNEFEHMDVPPSGYCT